MAEVVELDAEIHRAAVTRARELGMPVADYVARLVEQDCVGDHAASAHDRPWPSIIGIGNSGGSDVAGLKDEYLGEAVEADYP